LIRNDPGGVIDSSNVWATLDRPAAVTALRPGAATTRTKSTSGTMLNPAESTITFSTDETQADVCRIDRLDANGLIRRGIVFLSAGTKTQ
jgi:hypothetical protein